MKAVQESQRILGSVTTDSAIGRILVARGLPPRVLQDALRLQENDPRPIGQILIANGHATESMILEAWAEQLGLTFIETIEDLDGAVLQQSGVEWFLSRDALPLMPSSPRRVALVDPSDRFVVADIMEKLGGFTPVLAARTAIRNAVENWMISEQMPIGLAVEPLEDDASVPRWIDHLLERSVEERASDIHIEALGEKSRVRFRIDGVLYEVPAPPWHLHAAVVSRIKVLSDLNIAERRLPQDGKFPRFIATRPFDVRVSVIPGVYGEGVVLRLLERSGGKRLDDLGFSANLRARIDSLFSRSHGLILATGPTGSGKTTTLYAALQRLNVSERKIVTIEDPVEYDLPGVEQIQVHPKIGLTFAHGLRSILRHDPDVILVGEIRDPDTAAVAIQSSLTGHLVPSTLHTNDAPSSIARLIDMGVERFLVASAVVGILAQRLVRKICSNCKEEIVPSPEILSLYRGADLAPPERLFRGRGCLQCRGAGFRGRSAIGECLLIDEAVREAIHSRECSTPLVREAAKKQNFIPILVDGLETARAGETMVSEVLKVVVIE